MSGVISQDDFNLLQEQLIELKRYKYETSEREKKFITEIKHQREHIETLENEQQQSKKTSNASSLFSNLKTKVLDKGKMNEVLEENEGLKRTITENEIINKEQVRDSCQSEALKLNIKSMYDNNKVLEEEVLQLKKEIQAYTLKSEDQQQKINKLNVDMVDLHMTNEELENQIEELKLVSTSFSSSSSTNIVSAIGNVEQPPMDGAEQQQQQQISSPLLISNNSAILEELINSIENDQELWTISSSSDNTDDSSSVELKRTKLREKINKIIGSNQHTSPPISSSSPPLQHKKEVIFHPLGAPTYDPGEEKEKQKLRDTIKGLMEQIKEFDGKTLKTTSEISSLQTQVQELTASNTLWQEKHRNAEINRVKIEEKLEQEIKNLNVDLSVTKQEKVELLNQKEQEKAIIIKEKEQERLELLNQKEQEKAKLIKEKEQAQSELIKERETLESSISVSTSKFSNHVHNLEEEIKATRNQIDILNDKIVKLKNIKDQNSDLIKTLNEDIAIKETLIQNKVEDNNHLKENVKQLGEELAETKKTLDARDQEFSTTNSHCLELEDRLKKADEKVSRESSNFYSMTDQFNKLNSAMTALETKNKEIEHSNVELVQENQLVIKERDTLQQDLESTQTQLTETKQQLEEHETKVNQLTSQLEETSSKLQECTEELDGLKVTYDKVNGEHIELLAETAKLRVLTGELDSIKSQYSSLQEKVGKLEVQLADSETERKIAEKKNIRMIKDLKSELSKERSSVNLLSQSSSNVPNTPTQSPMMSQSVGSVSLPTTPLSTPLKSHQRTLSRGTEPFLSSSPSKLNNPQFMVKSSSVNNLDYHQQQQIQQQYQQQLQQQMQYQQQQQLTSSTSSSSSFTSQSVNDNGNLKMDLEVLGKKLGDLGTEKYKLEERIRTLEENVLILNQELDKKNKVVRFYISKTQLGKATSIDEKAKRLKGGASGSFWRNNDPQLVGEMVEKMEIMLQENILKNIQLSDDVEILGNETNRKMMFKVFLVMAAACVAMVAAQAPSSCTPFTEYSYAYSTLGFNFLRRNSVYSFAEAGGVTADVTGGRLSSFFRISFNNSQNVPMFEQGLTFQFGANNTAYVLSNGVCFEGPAREPISNTFIPASAKLGNQVTLGSSKYNTFYDPFLDGQHNFIGVYEVSTCLPITLGLTNVDDTLGEAVTNIFDFNNQYDPNAFNLPPPCYTPINAAKYEGLSDVFAKGGGRFFSFKLEVNKHLTTTECEIEDI
ncbi:hypothetical protein DFA_06042 [Cavenderia fasciculata]|uniref:Uncharacterized protein n=1 Tax=Cavenderia fasciculata TaxID=261658 RepID=F4PJY0_CACFS|nr:uncharacterized protein DFA_06042 [Cavenderia fasciculata]EGG23904.1 hypothetical protein DFA_06042 [Cavenderia fasciculata]|eukprot:XP_004361755.1 hypothetical protein DFA_06042 [Cavenderia fasciculata]